MLNAGEARGIRVWDRGGDDTGGAEPTKWSVVA
jgi:hypothetical protein